MELERRATSNKQQASTLYGRFGHVLDEAKTKGSSRGAEKKAGPGAPLKIIRLLPLGLNKNTEKSGRSAFNSESSTTSKHKIAGLGQSTWASLGLNKNKGKRPGSRDEPPHLT